MLTMRPSMQMISLLSLRIGCAARGDTLTFRVKIFCGTLAIQAGVLSYNYVKADGAEGWSFPSPQLFPVGDNTLNLSISAMDPEGGIYTSKVTLAASGSNLSVTKVEIVGDTHKLFTTLHCKLHSRRAWRSSINFPTQHIDTLLTKLPSDAKLSSSDMLTALPARAWADLDLSGGLLNLKPFN